MASFCDAADVPLLDRFHTYFSVIAAKTPQSVALAQRIRYQVYCVENPFENAAEHPDGLECDDYDSHAAHSLLIHKPSGAAVGTARLILARPEAPEQSFALQRICHAQALKRLPLLRCAEVSRFAISKQFRRRSTDTLYEGRESEESASHRRALAPLMTLGLIQSLVRGSIEHGVTHWCAAMEPTLLRLLAGIGIRFEPLGPMVEYHGLRQPCYCEVAPMLERVKAEQPVVWQVLTDGGQLSVGAAIAA